MQSYYVSNLIFNMTFSFQISLLLLANTIECTSSVYTWDLHLPIRDTTHSIKTTIYGPLSKSLYFKL
jgi:hypothetical protein